LLDLPYDEEKFNISSKREKVYQMKLELRVEIWSM